MSICLFTIPKKITGALGKKNKRQIKFKTTTTHSRSSRQCLRRTFEPRPQHLHVSVPRPAQNL